MSERIKAITDAIINKTTDEELRAIFETLDARINPVGNPNPVENTIMSVASVSAVANDHIKITPNPDGTWVLYIPPTQREHFEFGDDPADYDPLENVIKAPWDETDWETLEGAVLALLISVRNGDVVYNDGRVAS